MISLGEALSLEGAVSGADWGRKWRFLKNHIIFKTDCSEEFLSDIIMWIHGNVAYDRFNIT